MNRKFFKCKRIQYFLLNLLLSYSKCAEAVGHDEKPETKDLHRLARDDPLPAASSMNAAGRYERASDATKRSVL